MSIHYPNQITVDGRDIAFYNVDNDVYGKPRYVVHFSALGVELEDYGRIKGLTKYRAKWFGGGYVFTSFNIAQDLQRLLNIVDEYYKGREVE
jgi:hypothetical protein